MRIFDEYLRQRQAETFTCPDCPPLNNEIELNDWHPEALRCFDCAEVVFANTPPCPCGDIEAGYSFADGSFGHDCGDTVWDDCNGCGQRGWLGRDERCLSNRDACQAESKARAARHQDALEAADPIGLLRALGASLDRT